MNEENVLVIGNGFDLAHGMLTKYEHFIDYVKYRKYENDGMLLSEEVEKFMKIVPQNGFIQYLQKLTSVVPGWVDFEREIYKITKEIEFLFHNYESMFVSRIPNVYTEGTASSLLVDILLDFRILKNNYSNKSIYPKFYSVKYGINKTEILKRLRNDLDELIELLKIYLLSCQRKRDKAGTDQAIEQISRIEPRYVITFNYTDTYRLYNIVPQNVVHIHGELQSGNMVLGFDDEDETNLEFIYFKKYFQRIQKLTDMIDPKRVYKYMNGVPARPIIHFYGHSMDKTDEDVLIELKEIAKKFVIYKYDQADYEQKVINLIAVFGKTKATEMIKSGEIEFVDCEKK